MKLFGKELKMTPRIKRSLIRLGSAAAVLVPIVIIALILIHKFGIDNISREQIQDIVEQGGALAPLVFISITVLQVSFIPLPSAPTILAGSYLFGVVEGFFCSYIGTLIGASIAFILGRRIGRPFINWVAGDKESVDALFKKLHGREKVVLFSMFILPMFPDDLLCAIAGMLPISYGFFLLMQIVSRTVAIGGTLLLFSGEILPFEGWGLWVIGGIIAAIAALFVVLFIIMKKKHQNANYNEQNSDIPEQLRINYD